MSNRNEKEKNDNIDFGFENHFNGNAIVDEMVLSSYQQQQQQQNQQSEPFHFISKQDNKNLELTEKLKKQVQNQYFFWCFFHWFIVVLGCFVEKKNLFTTKTIKIQCKQTKI